MRAGLYPLAWATIRSLVFRDTSWVCFLLDFVGSAIGVVPEELGVVGCNLEGVVAGGVFQSERLTGENIGLELGWQQEGGVSGEEFWSRRVIAVAARRV